MPSFFIENFGCRATFADTTRIEHELRQSGYERCSDADTAQVIVLNTCTVTAAADTQAREAIRNLHRKSPEARILVTGCYAQRAPEELAALEGVDCVVGNSHQADIPRLVNELLDEPIANSVRSTAFLPLSVLLASNGSTKQQIPRLLPLTEIVRGKQPTRDDSIDAFRGGSDRETAGRRSVKIVTGDVFADMPKLSAGIAADSDRTRPVLKIQDGCNNRCAYCIIPSVRGKSRSLAPEEVIRAIASLASGGAKEVVLSGINLGGYGRDLDPRAELRDLVGRILAETGIEQLRFSSIEPMDITQDFVDLVASTDRIAPHFHIPLQSGSDKTLKKMHRWYRTEHYARRVGLIRENIPAAAIGADAIVGFPGELDKDFAQTLDFIGGVPLTYLHVFSFSARPGTAAAELPDQVPVNVIRDRARTLRELSAKKAAAFRFSQAGSKVRALTLHRGGSDWTEALTGNYLKVRVAGKIRANEWVEVVLSGDAG